MRLHTDSKLFNQAVRATAEIMGLPDIYVEKDYWVTLALFTIFNHKIGEDTVFKGGTALSKCYNLINRFSEDIDLVVLRREGETNSRLSKKIKTIGDVVNEVLPEVEIENLTHKMGMNRKTAHEYNKLFKGNYGQVRDIIVVEATWLGDYEPFVKMKINSFIGEMMSNSSQEKLLAKYDMLPFEVLVLEPTRTICEKIMSLVRFSHSANPIENLKNKIRHIYDLHFLLEEAKFIEFFNSTAFVDMFLKVADDDWESYKSNNHWLTYHPSDAIIFKELEETWDKLKPVYNNEFRHLVYGKLPAESLILSSLKRIKHRLENIEWRIKE